MRCAENFMGFEDGVAPDELATVCRVHSGAYRRYAWTFDLPRKFLGGKRVLARP